MSPSIPFRQLNMHKADLASVELNRVLAKNPAVCLLMEPCAAFNRVIRVPSNHVCVPNITLSSRPRTAVYIPKGLPYIHLEQLSNADCTVVLLETERGKVLVASCYLDSRKEVVQPWLTKLAQFINGKKIPTLLAFDCNAHSQLYGPDTNERGKEFEDFILNHHFLVENKGNTPTYHAFRNGESIDTYIDVTLTKNLVPLHNWRVHDHEFNGSDHHSISWSLPVARPPPKWVRPWQSADWDVFKNAVAEYDFHTPQNFTTSKIDKVLDRWYEVIEQGLDKACPKKKAKAPRVEMDWFSIDQKYLKNRVKRKYAIYKKRRIARNRKAFVRAKRAYHRSCRKGRRESWRMFVEKTPNETNMAMLFRLAQRRDKRTINTLLKSDGSLTDPGMETITCLTDTHFPAAVPGWTPTVHDSKIKIDTEIIRDRYDTWISESLVRKAFKRFKPNKAAGTDGLKPIVFKHLPDNAIAFLTLIYKACIALSYTPVIWRRTKVIFLPKPGKTTYDITKSYRPISLSNYPLKALERLGVWKVDKDMEASPIHPMQHGFTKGKSTESAISNTADYIERFLYNDMHCLGLFLDISSAFDSISIDHIRQSLLDHSADPEFVEWYYSYLGRRYLEVELHGERVELTTSTGFPQGGVCSARFWLVAFDEAIRIINTRGIMGNGYADDCSALIGGTHPSNMIESMQAMLDSLVAWGSSCGLRFNAQKTVAVMFSRSKRQFSHLVRMDGALLPYSESVVYLGVTLDRELKWAPHIHNKLDKARGLLMKFATIVHSYWGPRPKLLRWAYTGIVRCMVTYGALAWGHVMVEEHYDDLLRKLNRMAINTIVKVPRSTPTRGLEIILGIAPLHLQIKKEGLAAYHRLRRQLPLEWSGTYGNVTYSTSHRRYWQLEAEGAGINDFHASSDACSVARPDLRFILDTESFVDMAGCQTKARWNAYTDGSKLNGQVGAGVYIQCGGVTAAEESFRLPDESTVYQAEMMAIREAAAVLATVPNLTTVKFFVDSQAALRTFQAHIITSKLALQTIQTLNTIQADSPPVFVWTKAHVGSHGNEKADKLAKAGTLKEEVLDVGRPACEAKNAIDEYILSLWKQE